jgi:hypothetical protein
MAFSGNYMCTSFKKELLEGKHNFTAGSGHTFNLALYTSSATLDATTTDYSATNEASASAGTYNAGGSALTAISPTSSGTTAFTDFSDLTFGGSLTITARGALIYNTTTDGGTSTTDAVIVLDFGADKTSTNGDFTIQFPTADASNAIIRIA